MAAVISRLSADIEEIGFTEGGTVRKGQLLYRLDNARFVAAVSNQTTQIAETRAKLELATLTFDRKRKLAEKGMATALSPAAAALVETVRGMASSRQM